MNCISSRLDSLHLYFSDLDWKLAFSLVSRVIKTATTHTHRHISQKKKIHTFSSSFVALIAALQFSSGVAQQSTLPSVQITVGTKNGVLARRQSVSVCVCVCIDVFISLVVTPVRSDPNETRLVDTWQ